MEDNEITKKHYRCGMCGKPTDEEGYDLEPCDLKDLCVADLDVLPTCYDCFCDYYKEKKIGRGGHAMI
jgi:hypothetical protein